MRTLKNPIKKDPFKNPIKRQDPMGTKDYRFYQKDLFSVKSQYSVFFKTVKRWYWSIPCCLAYLFI